MNLNLNLTTGEDEECQTCAGDGSVIVFNGLGYAFTVACPECGPLDADHPDLDVNGDDARP